MDATYLDYAATTPVDSRVAKRMSQCLERAGNFGNPASRQHSFGRNAGKAVEQARAEVAALIGAQPAEIIWTSGATESNNLALKGVAEAYADRGRHIISMKTEHKSVVDTLRFLESRGWRVTWLAPDEEGRLPVESLEAALTEDTVLASIMLVNNETGVIQDIAAISKLVRDRGALLHVDAVQAAGKLPIDVEQTGIDLLSLSGHKIYGPKGVGALYVRRRPRVRVAEQMHGGGHERGMRSGTLPVHQVVGMGEACQIARENLATESGRIADLRDRLWAGLSELPGIYRNGSHEHCVCNLLNVSVAGVDGEALHAALARLATPLAISSGSACTAESQESSYVLRALGREDELAYSSIRFSLGRWTTDEEIDHAVSSTTAVINALRAFNPLWVDQVDLKPLELAASHPDYSDAVWRYFSLAMADHTPVGDELVRMQTPGSRAVLALHGDGDGRIRAKAYGCVSTLAVSAWLTEKLETLQPESISSEQIEESLELAAIKRHCALQAEDALERLVLVRSQNSVTAEQAAI